MRVRTVRSRIALTLDNINTLQCMPYTYRTAAAGEGSVRMPIPVSAQRWRATGAAAQHGPPARAGAKRPVSSARAAAWMRDVFCGA